MILDEFSTKSNTKNNLRINAGYLKPIRPFRKTSQSTECSIKRNMNTAAPWNQTQSEQSDNPRKLQNCVTSSRPSPVNKTKVSQLFSFFPGQSPSHWRAVFRRTRTLFAHFLTQRLFGFFFFRFGIPVPPLVLLGSWFNFVCSSHSSLWWHLYPVRTKSVRFFPSFFSISRNPVQLPLRSQPHRQNWVSSDVWVCVASVPQPTMGFHVLSLSVHGRIACSSQPASARTSQWCSRWTGGGVWHIMILTGWIFCCPEGTTPPITSLGLRYVRLFFFSCFNVPVHCLPYQHPFPLQAGVPTLRMDAFSNLRVARFSQKCFLTFNQNSEMLLWLTNFYPEILLYNVYSSSKTFCEHG